MTMEEFDMANQVERFEKQTKANQTRKIRDRLVQTFLVDDPDKKEPSLSEIKLLIKWLNEEAESLDKI